jgi:hypothetical protein
VTVFVFARATIPPEAAYLPLEHCIQCGQPGLPGDKVYADTAEQYAYPPKTLCRRCGRTHRATYAFASEAENWETTPK